MGFLKKLCDREHGILRLFLESSGNIRKNEKSSYYGQRWWQRGLVQLTHLGVHPQPLLGGRAE